ncbi:MAG: hypothetical protein ABR538_10405 [Candidatus Binatia bacterium]
MAGREGEPGAGPRQRRRIFVPLLAGLVLLAAAAWGALAWFATDLFTGVVVRAAAANGFEVKFEAPPAVSFSGFRARGVTVTSNSAEVLKAERVTGSVRLLSRRPWLGISITLAGVRLAPARGAGSANRTPNGPLRIFAVLPPVLSAVSLEQAQVDLGDGRRLLVDAGIVNEADGSLDLEWTRLDYSESSGETAAEKLRGSLRLSPAAAAPAGTAAPADAAANPATTSLLFALEIESGAALAGSVLLDFSAHPLFLSGRIADRAGGGHEGSGLAMSLGKLLRATGRVEVDADGGLRTGNVEVASENLAPAFTTLVREPFGGVYPALADAEVAGKGKVALVLAAPTRHSADITLSLALTRLVTRSVEAESVVLDVPWSGVALGKRAERKGRIRAARFSLLGLPWRGLDAPLASVPGRLAARGDQEWKAAGGTLHISNFVAEDDARQGPRLSATLRLVGFDLGQLGETFGVAGLAGTLEGDLGRVRVDADAVSAEGSVTAATFGGSVVFSRLHIEHPFGRVPSVGLDAKLSEILLGNVTDFLGVGGVSGVLEGSVTNLVLAAGQPQAFDADLHTVSRRGVSQTVDVRAIQQLGVLGGGDSGSITGSLLRVIDRYRYSKLGLRARLRNDVFELRGVETDKGRDYIVKGSLLPPSVSVVSHSQVVSFSEMLRRIDRIAAIGEGGTPNAVSD